jgi:hypothetical protein
MTNLRTYITGIILIVFMAMAVFGLYFPMIPMGGHDSGCPFAVGGTSLCAQPFAHIEHWQSNTLTILTEIFILVSLLFVAWLFGNYPPLDALERQRYRMPLRSPPRPTLLQELFSQGILNRRAP